jgi:hypothetical protein
MAWTSLATMRASAQETGPAPSDRISLAVEACPSVPTAAVRHILSVEIGDLLLGEGSAAAGHRLTIRCVGHTAWVEAAGEGGADPVDRTLRLDSFPGDAAPRALALAGLELLAARSPAVRARMQARQEPATPLPPAPTVGGIRHPRSITHLGMAGAWRRFWAGQGLSTLGGQAQLGVMLRPWRFCADIEATGASRDAQLGKASALLLSGSAAFGLIDGTRHLAVTLLLGARLGMARLWGSAEDPTVAIASAVVRPWGGPTASLGVLGTIEPLAVVVTVEAGRSLFTAEAQSDRTTVLAVGGTWVAISLGAAFMR